MYLNTVTTADHSELTLALSRNLDYRSDAESKIITLASAPHWALFNYIFTSTGISLSDSERALIVETVKIKKLRKRQFFLQESDVCKYIGFISTGSTRMFSINERGQESIISFGLENSFVVDQDSFSTNEASSYHIEAMEDTCLLLITCAQLDYLKSEIPAFSLMFDRQQQKQLVQIQKRINAALSMNAEERYYDLLNAHPEYAQRFSQNMLACYLGVKAETLSRIRKR